MSDEVIARPSKTYTERAAEWMTEKASLLSIEQRVAIKHFSEWLQRHAPETTARPEKLETALRGLYWDNVDYLTLNHLGGMDNHWMKAAREALGIRDAVKADEHVHDWVYADLKHESCYCGATRDRKGKSE